MSETSGHTPGAPTTLRRLTSDRVVSNTVKLGVCRYFLNLDREFPGNCRKIASLTMSAVSSAF